jgi:hypothetical protein
MRITTDIAGDHSLSPYPVTNHAAWALITVPEECNLIFFLQKLVAHPALPTYLWLPALITQGCFLLVDIALERSVANGTLILLDRQGNLLSVPKKHLFSGGYLNHNHVN